MFKCPLLIRGSPADILVGRASFILFVILLAGCHPASSDVAPASLSTSTMLHCTTSWISYGDAGHKGFGISLTPIPDLNGDGVNDCVVAAYPIMELGITIAHLPLAGEPGRSGVVYFLSGRDGHIMGSSLFDASLLAYGLCVATIPDIDHDGLEDVAVGAPALPDWRDVLKESPPQHGTVALLSSGTRRVIAEIHGRESDSGFGTEIALSPEARILAIGSDNGLEVKGTVTLYSLEALKELWRFEAPTSGDKTGRSIAFIADVDTDGVPDIGVGAGNDGSSGLRGAGSIVLLSGASGKILRREAGKHAFDRFGASIAHCDDIDGDGTPDLIVSAPGEGESGVFSGTVYCLSATSMKILWTSHGVANEERGLELALGPDVDGDGIRDIAVGCARNLARGFKGGYFVVLSGRTGTEICNGPGGHVAMSLERCGSGGGFLVGSPQESASGSKYGVVRCVCIEK